MNVILALDQGTSSSRTLVVDEGGGILSSSQLEMHPQYPAPGWVEEDPEEIWATQLATALEALRACGATAADVAGIGISCQRETTLVWDRRTGEPIAPAIVWQDRRTAADCEELKAAGGDALVRARTGLLLDPYFSATKLRWLLRNVPGAGERAQRGELAFGTVDTWLVWKLSRGRLHVTDASNASRTLLYDIRRGEWSDELLELFDIPRELLPTVCDSSGVMGETDAGVLGAPVPVAGIAGDQQAALFGQACTAPGMTKVTYGTGCFLLQHTGEQPVESLHGLLTTVALQRAGRRTYAIEGSVFIGGAAVQWLRDGLGIISSAPEVDGLAAGVADNGGVVFVPALAGLGAPYWDPLARGAVFGLTRGTSTAHLARATLEGVAFQVAELAEAVASDAGAPAAAVRVDGGASGSDLLLQFQADVLGAPVVRTAQMESSALGAAYLAGLGAGVWRDEADVAALWKAGRSFTPDSGVDRERLLKRWRAAVASVRAFAAEA